MWVKHGQRLSYGVSVGVRSFVRPLYLYKKLHTLIKRENDEVIRLSNVAAFEVEPPQQHQPPQQDQPPQQRQPQQQQDQNIPKPPCITCQYLFDGFTSKPKFPIGNCAEYDIIGKVPRNLLETQPWRRFVSACQQHLHAFNAMNREILNGAGQSRKILQDYFDNAHAQGQKVLKCEWNPEERAFDIICTIWPRQ